MSDVPDRAADRYTHGHHRSVVGQHARRTAERDAAFLLPHLRPGMRLLDIGCGPGSITGGLARAVDPGVVVGVDVEPAVLEAARELAGAQGLANVRFEEASAYELPFDAASFDAVYAHQVLQHLARPVDALHEMRRVLAPGGVVAVRDADYGTMSAWPRLPAIERWLAVYHTVAERNGADADAGRRLPSWLRVAGFERIEVSADVVVFTDRESVENWGHSWAERVMHSSLAEQALEYGVASRQELELIAEGWRAWAAAPDAFFMYVNVQCLAVEG